MRLTGKKCKLESEYDLDHKITDVQEITENFIKQLIDEVGQKDYNKIAKVIIGIHLDNIN